MKSLSAFLVCILTTVFIAPLLGQTLKAKYTVDSKLDAACELNSRYIDSLVADVKQNDYPVFIISRRSAKEKAVVDFARLSSAVSILNQVKDVELSRIVTATAEPVSNSKGRIEFYFNNELFLVSYAEHGKHP